MGGHSLSLRAQQDVRAGQGSIGLFARPRRGPRQQQPRQSQLAAAAARADRVAVAAAAAGPVGPALPPASRPPPLPLASRPPLPPPAPPAAPGAPAIAVAAAGDQPLLVRPLGGARRPAEPPPRAVVAAGGRPLLVVDGADSDDEPPPRRVAPGAAPPPARGHNGALAPAAPAAAIDAPETPSGLLLLPERVPPALSEPPLALPAPPSEPSALALAPPPAAASGPVTFYQPGGPLALPPPPAVAVAIRPAGPPAQRLKRRRAGVSAEPPVPLALPEGTAATAARFAGKGARHANRCAGPYACALERMPAIPPTGAKRASAGLARAPLLHTGRKLVMKQRAARALVAVLPREVAPFVLHDPAEHVARQPVAATAERLVDALMAHGTGSLEGASSLLGRFLTWMIDNRPSDAVAYGSHLQDFLKANPPSATTMTSIVWVRDHLGIDLPARSSITHGHRGGSAPVAPRPKESFSFAIMLGLEIIAATHESEFVRGHAAGWLFIIRAALRLEQGQACVLNSIVQHVHAGRTFRIACAAVLMDKNPNPAHQKPRPVWAAVDGILFPDAIIDGISPMLEGAHADAQCILLDTDSSSGAPADATEWLLCPLEGARVKRSLVSLLQLAPISLSAERAGAYAGHSAKRSLLSVCEASPYLSEEHAIEVGRFSASTAQRADLEPRAQMLLQHKLRCAALPAIYARKSCVLSAFDKLCTVHRVLVNAATLGVRRPELLPVEGDWSEVFRLAEPPLRQADIQDQCPAHSAIESEHHA